MKHFFYPVSLALLACLLLDGCSHSTPTAETGTASAGPAAAAPAKRTAGTRADSLDGIPGHHFGEPLGAFPGLLEGESNIKGMRRYYYPSEGTAHGTGWFGKHAPQLKTSYYFVDNQFAYFMTTAYGDNRQLLNQEINYLFGKGDHFHLNDAIWQGKKARAIYTQPFTTYGPAAQLEIASEPLEAKQKEREAARLKAENSN